ncbi:Predicted metal-dependent hydrolase, TIM-barrel fold [Arsukibacterium tuosuense]|uniref:Predicted metal-dependent hydrolase, TIM-barrel fold n=1 Tax=Arsukibacterium tuosuense TaxID=1323745 RepID=A0A285J3G7_9GAMM|nr:amidohydrolase family protein [Arsukibacterium tuosuense]SNY54814.1 Predicted metal-dependent hydrolase, TIM-barrel fold [Arsukibacterium tuosuense]
MTRPELLQIIDPHLHLWQLSAGQYHWLQSKNPPAWPDKALLQQDYSAAKLALTTPFKLAALVHIEAGFDNSAPECELAWLAGQQLSLPHKAVAFLDCSLPFEQILSNLQALLPYQPAGVRHIFEGDDERWLHAPQLEQIAGMLAQHKLVLELQCSLANPKNLARIQQLAQQFPDLTLVLNHAGLVQPEHFQPWQQAIQLLASSANVAMKLSGWELINAGRYSSADPAWQQQVFAAVLSEWPLERLMLASNFPLCLWQGSYQQLWQRYYQLLTSLGLSSTGWQQLSAGTARAWYGLTND